MPLTWVIQGAMASVAMAITCVPTTSAVAFTFAAD